MAFQFDLQMFDNIKNTWSNTVVNGSMNADSIQNADGSNVIINAGMGDDSVDSWGSNVIIDAGMGDDYIYLYIDAYNTNVDAGMGNDEIYSGAQTAMITAGMGDDYIHLYEESTNTTVNGGMGNDTVRNYSPSFVYVHNGSADGYDVIRGFTSSSKIVLSDNYSTQQSGSDLLINVEGSQIRLVDYNGSVNINGTLDTIDIPTVPTVEADEIVNYNQYSVVSGTSYDDTIENYAGGVTILAGAGDDYIYSSTDDDYRINDRYGYVTIDGGNGNDTISVYDPRTSINGGAGDDLITLRGDYGDVTVNGGSGNDTLRNAESTFVYEFGTGDGYDVINGFNSDSTIKIINGTYSTQQSGSDLIINVDGSQIRLVDYNGTVNIDGTPEVPTYEGGLYIDNPNGDTLLRGSDYDDTIYNDFAEYISIIGGDGDDSIYGTNNYGTLDGGDGNDTILGNHWRTMLNGANGDDFISLTTYWYNTIEGGAGDDTLIADGSEHFVNGGAADDMISLGGDSILIRYASGDGNDIIYGVNESDTLTISGASYSTVASGADMLIKVGTDGTITVDGGVGKSLNINNVVEPEPQPTQSGGVTQQEVIRKFMYSLDQANTSSVTTMIDNAIAYASDSKYTSMQQAINAMISDLRSYQSVSNGWKKFLLDKCDINLDNNDTGAISGFETGGSTVEKTASSIVPEYGNVDRTFTDNYFAADGLNVYLAKANGYRFQTINYYDSSLSDTERYIWQALHSWWLDGSLELIADSYGNNFGFTSQASSTVPDNKIYVTFYTEPSNTLAYVSSWFDGNGVTNQLQLATNMYTYSSIVENDPNGQCSSTSFYLDRTLAHEFTHAVMSANIRNFAYLPMFIKEGMAELTHGIDDERNDEITTLAMNPNSLLRALDINTTNGYYDAYAGGFMFLRYIAKQFSSDAASSYEMISSPAMSGNNLPDGVSIDNDELIVSTAFEGSSIDMSAFDKVMALILTALDRKITVYGSTLGDLIEGSLGANKIFSGSGGDTIYGGEASDTIYGGDDNDLIVGNGGADSLFGGAGRNTLTGGDGADMFINENGADLIMDYEVGEDRIKLARGLVMNSMVDGDDVVLRTSGGSITVKGGANNELTIVDQNEHATVRVFSDETFVAEPDELTADNWTEFEGVTLKSTKLTLKTPFTGTVDLINFSSKLKNVDASKDVNAVNVVGNDNKNVFKAGSGGSTLDGAGGNDKLYGGDGIDVFIYDGQGKDKIYKYDVGDRIVLGEEINKVKLSGKNLKVTVEGGGVLTVNKIFETPMTITTADGQTNTYIFDKKHKTLDAALENANAQLIADDYWFIDQSTEESPLTEIISTESAVDFDYDQTVDALKQLTPNLTYSARHRFKK